MDQELNCIHVKKRSLKKEGDMHSRVEETSRHNCRTVWTGGNCRSRQDSKELRLAARTPELSNVNSLNWKTEGSRQKNKVNRQNWELKLTHI